MHNLISLYIYLKYIININPLNVLLQGHNACWGFHVFSKGCEPFRRAGFIIMFSFSESDLEIKLIDICRQSDPNFNFSIQKEPLSCRAITDLFIK